jgi:uncharacterized protein (DUF697 family)
MSHKKDGPLPSSIKNDVYKSGPAVALRDLRNLFETVKDEFAGEERPQTANVAIYYDESCSRALRAYAEGALNPLTRTIYLHTETFNAEHCEVDPAADLTIIFAGDSPWVGATTAFSKMHGIPTVVVTEDLATSYASAEATGFALEAADFVSFELAEMEMSCVERLWHDYIEGHFEATPLTGYDLLFSALGSWIVAHVDRTVFVLAAAFPFIRRPLAHSLCMACAYQNAVVAAAVFLPGADMPLMLANQMRMVFQISSAYGRDITQDVIAELTLVGTGSYALRGVARSLSNRFPTVGVVPKILVSFGGTFALGYAAIAYCEQNERGLISRTGEEEGQ